MSKKIILGMGFGITALGIARFFWAPLEEHKILYVLRRDTLGRTEVSMSLCGRAYSKITTLS